MLSDVHTNWPEFDPAAPLPSAAVGGVAGSHYPPFIPALTTRESIPAKEISWRNHHDRQRKRDRRPVANTRLPPDRGDKRSGHFSVHADDASRQLQPDLYQASWSKRGLDPSTNTPARDRLTTMTGRKGRSRAKGGSTPSL